MPDTVSHDSETPAYGQQVITACAFIHQNFNGLEKVFLPKRAETKKFLPGVCELPGGHLNFGEDIVEGLKREIREELNMEIGVGDPFFAFTYKNDIKGSHSVEVIFFAKFINSLKDLKINPEDHSEYKWLTKSEVVGLKEEGDPEIRAILKGFSLISGDDLDFG